MINLYSVSNDLITRLRQNSYFEDTVLCCSFPKTVKPTLLSHPAIAVSVCSVNFDEASLGDNVMAGTVSVSADVFIPALLRNQISLDEFVSQICKSAAGMRIVSVSCEKPQSNKYAECIEQKIIITFNDEICFEEQ